MMPWADLAIIIVLLVSVGYGTARGGLYELFNLFSWLVAFFAAYYYRSNVSNALKFYIEDELIRSTLSFGLVFFVGYILTSLLFSVIHQMFGQGPPGPANRLFGLVIGVVRGWALVVIGLVLVDLIGVGGGVLEPGDWIAKYFEPGVTWLDAQVPGLLEWVNEGPEELPVISAE